MFRSKWGITLDSKQGLIAALASAAQQNEALFTASDRRGGGEILLRGGQVGTVVVELSNGEAFEIEFSQSDGQAYAMLAVKANQLIRLYYEPVELAAVG